MVRFDLGPMLQGQMRVAKLKSPYNLLIIMLFIFKTILVGLFQWIHLAPRYRCILGLVSYVVNMMIVV